MIPKITNVHLITSSMMIGETIFIETVRLHGFIYKTGIINIRWELMVDDQMIAEDGLLDALGIVAEEIYVEYIPMESVAATQVVTEGIQQCKCDWISVQQVGCKCGAIAPYQGGLYYEN